MHRPDQLPERREPALQRSDLRTRIRHSWRVARVAWQVVACCWLPKRQALCSIYPCTVAACLQAMLDAANRDRTATPTARSTQFLPSGRSAFGLGALAVHRAGRWTHTRPHRSRIVHGDRRDASRSVRRLRWVACCAGACCCAERVLKPRRSAETAHNISLICA